MMTRLTTGAALLLCACSDGGPASTPAPTAKAPNILVVTLDTTRRDSLSPYGGPKEGTPVLERIARQGARFDRAYTVTPLTIPAHSSLHTGLLPPRHGVRDNGDQFLSDSALTLAEQLKGAGYATMASVGAEVTSHHWGFAQGFDAYFDDMGEAAEGERNRWRVERRGDKVVDDALGWLQSRAGQEAPFFAWVHLFDAHHPYEPPDSFRALFPDRPYLGEIAFADAQLGRVLTELERQDPGLMNTWIFVLADHGESMGAHGEGMHGVLLYDETTAIPLVVRPAGGLPTPRIIQAPASIVDILPTALAAAGLPLPQDIDGQALSGWLSPEPAPPEGAMDRVVYMESLYGWHHYGWAPQRAVAEGQYKLIDTPTTELYAKADGAEATNLAATQPEQRQRLLDRMDALAAGLLPLEGAASSASLSPDRIAQLEALGYVTTNAGSSGDVPWRDASLSDPVARLPILKRLEEVRKAQQSGDLNLARKVAEQILAEEPGLVDPARTLAGILLRLGDLDAAEKVVADLDARQPSSNNKAMLASIHMRRADLDGAITLYGAALEMDPYVAGTWTPYLHALWIKGDLSRLNEELARVHALIPDHAIAQGMGGVVMAMQRQCGPAVATLQRAIAAEPMQPFVHHALGMCQRAMGEVDEAETNLLEEVDHYPPALPSRRALVEIYTGQKRYDEQLAQLLAIEAKEPAHPLTAHSKGQVLFNLGRYAESRPVVERCMELAPDYPGCVMLYANVLKKLGEEEKAVETYHRALAMADQRPPTAAAEEPAITAPEAGAADPIADPTRYWKE